MARIYIPALWRVHAEGQEWVSAEGETCGETLAWLAARYPELQGLLGKGTAIAIDGEIVPGAIDEPVTADTEIHILQSLQGGQ